MKKYFLITVIFMMWGFMGSCVSFKPDPPLPTEPRIERIQLCKKIEDRGDLLNPLEIQSEFTSKDELVFCFIQLKDIPKKITLRWKWYSPKKVLVRDTGDVIVNEDEKYLEDVSAYDKFELFHKDNIEGQWTVVVFVNGKLIEKVVFQVTISTPDYISF